jgi:hypothetical protein
MAGAITGKLATPLGAIIDPALAKLLVEGATQRSDDGP